ncbi:hypothetical protein ES708_27163 [subsurface metagenome]
MLLQGRQLFISEDIRELATKGQLTKLPYEICIVLCDVAQNVLRGVLWLRYLEGEEWIDCQSREIGPGQWLFTEVPRGKEFYRVEGNAPGHYDPKLPEHQFMAEDYLKTYRYHVLLWAWELILTEQWTAVYEPPEWELVIYEPWGEYEEVVGYDTIIIEPWTWVYEEPEWELIIYEPWGVSLEFELIIYEPWTMYYEPPEMELILEESWG